MNDETNSQALLPVPATGSAPPANPPAKRKNLSALWLIIAVLALGLAGWQWAETRQRLAETQREMAKRLSKSDAAASESRALAKQAQERLGILQDRLNELEERLAESKNQQEMLVNLYKNFEHGTVEPTLTEIEQNVTLASQQLQLAGNLPGAILALEAADARLADNSQPPQFIDLRKALTRDLERLRALPQPDIPGMYLRLENVIDTIGTLPLAALNKSGDERQEKTPGEPAHSPLSMEYWRALAADFWGEMRSLVRIQRIDREEPVLLPPGQDFFLRENIKLRLSGARLALFARDQQTYRHEMERSCVWIERYFDGNEKSVRNSLQTLRQLAAAEIRVELPGLNESLSAIRRFRAEKEQ